MIKVLSYPHLEDIQPNPTAGISQVVKHYFLHLPKFGVELLPKEHKNPDVIAIHAASSGTIPRDVPLVSHCHGLYFTADSKMDRWTYEVNAAVIDIVRHANTVTVPSNWVAEIFRRDMHFNPAIIPHGVEWDEWQSGDDQGYVLWNKNRASDACDPMPVNQLAIRAPKTRFLTTYAAPDPRPNIKVVGTIPYNQMREMILGCSVYLATTKETFGIGTLEAMAAGKPILGFDYGGTADLVKHGYSGYLARPGNYEDLAQGLDYCLKHRDTLGRNAAQVARYYTWSNVAERVAEQYALTVEGDAKVPTIGVVIPMYNKAATVLRAIRSAIHQSRRPNEIIVVNNNSTDDWVKAVETGWQEAADAGIGLTWVNCEKQGVAHARNLGIQLMDDQDFICCLDADDEIMPEFLDRCYHALAQDRSLGIAYTALEAVSPDGRSGISAWPGVYDFNKTLRGQNQVPTCCLFRRKAWSRVGGYRQRYAPEGAGSEDADLWLRIGLAGWNAARATDEPLFRYYLGGAVSGNKEYQEKDWRGDKGWISNGELPFAATSTPVSNESHSVRQYDEPEISVIIPVGPGHFDTLIDALDSVEGQTYRRWELIVINDGGVDWESAGGRQLRDAFPYMRWYDAMPNPPRGAGYARNLGARLAKAPLLLFLDADDWLVPTALAELMRAHQENPDAIIYSDYIGHAYIDDPALLTRLRQAERLLDYNAKTHEAKVRYHAFDFDQGLAQRQPVQGKDPYIWNVISSLVPAEYHREIGGFDEEMKSWEDWDYWVRLAKAGKCFCRINMPLLEYRFYTGKRRSLANPSESGESGRQLSADLLEYMRTKYEGVEIMPAGCRGCGGGRRSSVPPPALRVMSMSEGNMGQMTSGDIVMVELVDGNIGEHPIVFQGRTYGYRSHGDKFEMLRAHASLDRRVRIIQPNESVVAVAKNSKVASMPPPPPAQPVVAANNNDADQPPAKPSTTEPTPVEYTFDLTSLWGINDTRAAMLLNRGVRSPDGVIAMGIEGVIKLFDVPELTAKRIVSEAEKTKTLLADEKTKVKAK